MGGLGPRGSKVVVTFRDELGVPSGYQICCMVSGVLRWFSRCQSSNESALRTYNTIRHTHFQ
jgi:hypothetical protein